jgi:hypothetical protein
VAALALVSACVAACTSTTSGNGSALGQGQSTSSTTGASSFPSFPVSGGAGTTPATTFVPSPIPAPAACPGGTCKQNMSSSVSAPFTVIVRTNPAYGNGQGATILELTDSGVPVSWYVVPAETPAEITCSSTPNEANCVLVDHVGAHGSDAIVFRISGGTLKRGSTVVASTPEMHAGDLNDDGWIDAAGLQNNGSPDYVTGKVYWQTWVSDGLRLNSTGCTALASTPGPQPTTPARGNCP